MFNWLFGKSKPDDTRKSDSGNESGNSEILQMLKKIPREQWELWVSGPIMAIYSHEICIHAIRTKLLNDAVIVIKWADYAPADMEYSRTMGEVKVEIDGVTVAIGKHELATRQLMKNGSSLGMRNSLQNSLTSFYWSIAYDLIVENETPYVEKEQAEEDEKRRKVEDEKQQKEDELKRAIDKLR